MTRLGWLWNLISLKNGCCGNLWVRPVELATLGIRLTTAKALCLDAMLTQPQTCVHRDYHCRNLLFDDKQLGIVDFQDALMGPGLYDIASLLRDCYYRHDEAQVDHYLHLFLKRSPYFDATQFVSLKRAFDLTAIQRQLKALSFCALAPTRRQEQPPGMDRACAASPSRGRPHPFRNPTLKPIAGPTTPADGRKIGGVAMKAMILAAGQSPFSAIAIAQTLIAGRQALLIRQIRQLRTAGITDLVINLYHLGDQIEAALGDGNGWNIAVAIAESPSC